MGPQNIDEEDEDADDGSDEDADSPAHPIHDASHVLNYPSKSTRSDEGVEIALCSSWMKQHILLSLLRSVYQPLDPRSVRKAMVSPGADGWKDAMSQEMANLKLHDVYELVPHMNSPQTSLGISSEVYEWRFWEE